MADVTQRVADRSAPLSAAPLAFASVSIGVAPPMRRWSLRARTPEALEALLGLPLPRRIGETRGDIACLGPDEWLWRGPEALPRETGSGLPLSLVDISDRAVAIVLDGVGARAVLSAGCPLDLEQMAVGRTTRTLFEGVEIILTRESETRWMVDVWRSFAQWLWLSLTTAAAHPLPE